jgi:hypothetical protein
MSAENLSWGWTLGGAAVGTVLFLGGVVWFGRRFMKRMNLDDRGDWDRPLAEPFPKDKVVATYVRRKEFHRRHRDHYLRRRDKQDPQAGA